MKDDKQLLVLRNFVMQALQGYFDKLDGQQPVDLYALAMREFEIPLLEMSLRHVGNNQTKLAQILGLSRGTLRKKLQQYKLDNFKKKMT